MQAEIDTRGFDEIQWELFYKIRNLEWRKGKFEDQLHKEFPDKIPFTAVAPLATFSREIKRNRSKLIEYTSYRENNTASRRKR